jgi:pimeloyl-ACP methyl ester carboxylesterase
MGSDGGSAKIVEQVVQSGGVRLNVAVAGEGRPVVLLHGFPDSWRLWTRQIESLTRSGFRVIAPDLRGHGGSHRPADAESYRASILIADILAVLDHFEVSSVAVVGHDWGAALAWNLAFRHRKRVERLAVLSVGHPGAAARAGIRQRQLSWYMLWFLHPGVAESVLPADDWVAFRQWAWNGAARGTDPDMDRQIDDLSRPGALAAALNLYRANIRPETYFLPNPPPMPRVTCPVLGIWSTGDPFLCEAQMTGSQDFVDGSWRYEVLDGGHWIPGQAPERLNALLTDFLA